MASESKTLRVLSLFEQYYERVYCFARRSVEPSSAEDIAQEVFVRLLNVPDLETREIHASYLIKIAENLIKRGHRRKQLLDQHTARERRKAEHENKPAGRRTEAGADAKRRLKQDLGSLTPHEQEAVRLIVLRGLSYDEAARALGVTTSSVNNWKFRGLQRLKQHSSRQEEVAGRDTDGTEAVRDDIERDQPGRARFGQRAG